MIGSIRLFSLMMGSLCLHGSTLELPRHNQKWIATNRRNQRVKGVFCARMQKAIFLLSEVFRDSTQKSSLGGFAGGAESMLVARTDRMACAIGFRPGHGSPLVTPAAGQPC
jgi:hypothetical protein